MSQQKKELSRYLAMAMQGQLLGSVRLRKLYTEKIFVMLYMKRMQLRSHADPNTVKRSQH